MCKRRTQQQQRVQTHPTSRTYYTLAVMHQDSDLFKPEFGDYDRDLVREEQCDMMRHSGDSAPTASQIIKTYSDGQADIDKAILKLNGGRS